MALYSGISFPFQKGTTAFPLGVTDNDLIKQDLIQLITTGRGERVMRPTVGCNAMSFVFEPNIAATDMLIKTEIQNAVAKWEPRVILQDVEVQFGTSSGPTDSNGPSAVTITIKYIVVATQQTQAVTIEIPGGP